jgi:hypothetical protein
MPRAFRHLLPCSFAVLVAAAVPGAIAGCAPASPESTPDEVAGDGPEPTGDRGDAVGSGSVNDAVASSCATSSVKGLSDQIIAEGQCLEPSAYAQLPELGNLKLGPNVFPFLEKPARDKLVAALQASPGKSMTVNSMLRTVAQQYLLYRWYQGGMCGIGLAAKPGNSNHETGLAFDTNDASAWKSALTSNGFKWFGSADPVHFDYVGSGAKSFKGTDVKAFQRLWNRNNPKDTISEDGSYGPATESRLKQAPAQGFALGADCGPDNGGSGGASSTSATTSTSSGGSPACAHAICAAGGALASACDPCAKTVCASDAYCCSTSWDATCVQEAGSMCGASCGGSTSTSASTSTSSGGGNGGSPWSCNGSYGTTKVDTGEYYATAFGCWTDGNGNIHQDSGDNCIPSCLAQAKSSGLCAEMSGPQCEENTKWYAADGARCGCLARLKVTNPSNGKSVVVVALDYGPSCTLENKVSHGIVDLSSPTNAYLFGSDQGYLDKALVQVDEVDAATPLGPQ